jgi:hypothetical protein
MKKQRWKARALNAEAQLAEARERDMARIIGEQRAWSREIFGPGHRTPTILAHIRKELDEIEANPLDITEWIDVAMLALDGAWRVGPPPTAIVEAWSRKAEQNRWRTWPEPTSVPDGQPIEHVRDGEPVSLSEQIERARQPGCRCIPVLDLGGGFAFIPGESRCPVHCKQGGDQE